ncbi:MAG: DUF2911 domain-containing protein [Cytophagales bacterium]|nr:MAG: DUF2911 domain-containing protein [Cytophagales bacterium]
MKKLNVLFFALAVLCCINVAQAQVTPPAPSPSASITQVVGLTNVSVNYSRPSAKGRAVFGSLVKYDQVWRTGANQATKITFADEVTIMGNKLAKGEYAIMSIPSQSAEWTVIFSKNLGVNEGNYKMEEDALRVKVKPTTTANKVESFTVEFTDLGTNSANLEFSWENTSVKVKIEADVDAKVEKQIADFTNPNKDANGFFQASSYYFNNGKDLNKAYDWIVKSTSMQPQFWTLYLKAQIEMKLKKYKDAIATAEKSTELAKAANNTQYVEFNEKLLAEAKKMK